jgi:hypothetical protein
MALQTGLDGVTIHIKVSPAQPHEYRRWGLTAEESDQLIRDQLRQTLEKKYPGAAVDVQSEGDKPTATVDGTEDSRIIQALRYDAERTALKIKWDFGQEGPDGLTRLAAR